MSNAFFIFANTKNKKTDIKKIKVFTMAVIIGSFAYYYANKNTEKQLDITIANIEALASGEDSGSGSGIYDILQDESNHYYNGELYKQSKVVNCYEGGSKACSSDKYYRLKNSDGTWGNWIPA